MWEFVLSQLRGQRSDREGGKVEAVLGDTTEMSRMNKTTTEREIKRSFAKEQGMTQSKVLFGKRHELLTISIIKI